MKKDIEGREDIVELLERFYQSAFRDPLIGHFFTEVVKLDLETHIPVIADFWERIVFGTRLYKKNVMEVHQHIHGLSSIQKAHLERWVQLFHGSIDGKYEGSNADLMKQRAASIATLMNIKLNHPNTKSLL